jgi:hypothetical protein
MYHDGWADVVQELAAKAEEVEKMEKEQQTIMQVRGLSSVASLTPQV